MRMDLKRYAQLRDLINLARNQDQLKDAIKLIKAEAKGQDLKDLMHVADAKAKQLDYISSGANRALIAGMR